MAYNKKKILLKAKEVIVKHKLFFIEDIVAYLPISKPTFYVYFPVNSNEFNELKDLLETNTTQLKVSMRSKLSMQIVENENTNTNINIDKTEAEILEELELLKSKIK